MFSRQQAVVGIHPAHLAYRDTEADLDLASL